MKCTKKEARSEGLQNLSSPLLWKDTEEEIIKVIMNEYITMSLASNDETTDHLENLFETGSLTDEKLYSELHSKIEILGKKINRFLQSVQKEHLSDK